MPANLPDALIAQIDQLLLERVARIKQGQVPLRFIGAAQDAAWRSDAARTVTAAIFILSSARAVRGDLFPDHEMLGQDAKRCASAQQSGDGAALRRNQFGTGRVVLGQTQGNRRGHQRRFPALLG